MQLNRKRVQKYLKGFDFESLFIEELFWDAVDIFIPPIIIDETSYPLQAIAQKRELIIYGCLKSGQQIWQWVKREGKKRPILKETHFNIQ